MSKLSTSPTVPAPWRHQAATTSFFTSREVGHDFSSPGTGKTRGHLIVYSERKASGRLLVLCPKTLMYSAWGADIEKFFPGMTFSLAYAENRQEAFDLRSDVVIANIDGVKWVAKNLDVLKGFDHLIIDESNAYKNPTAQRSKAAKFISMKFKRKYSLTGTPNPNSVTELWHPTLLLDGGKRLGTSFFRFRSIMQLPTQVGPSARHIRWDDKPGAAQAVQDLLRDITIRHAFEDVMKDVPANHRDVKTFQLNRKTRAIYDRMEQDAFVALSKGNVTAVHAASLRTKLLQIASGAVYSEDGYEVIDTQRYELVADLIEEREHSVCFYMWKHQRDQLQKELKARDVTFATIDGDTSQKHRDDIVKRFQSGAYQTLLMHPDTGAHGLTLTAADTTILCSPTYRADHMKQMIHRVYRGGQTKATNTLLVRAENTVEEGVYTRLDSKYEKMVDLLELLTERRKR